MDVFNIIGPIMVGPSSSHTAGAVRIGLLARAISGGEEPQSAHITLHGSFAATGKGHGTDKALVAGLLGMQPDDERLPQARELARQRGLEVVFDTAQLGDVHPNTARVAVTTAAGVFTVTGSSIGGGEVRVVEIDGYPVDLRGSLEAVVTRHTDQPGVVALVATLLAARGVNIATMRLSRHGPGGKAMMVVECDGRLPDDIAAQIKNLGGMDWVVHVHPVS